MIYRPGGPTKLTDELLDKIYDYINNYKDYGDTMPTVGGLSMVLNINRSTLYLWLEKAKADNKKKIYSDYAVAHEMLLTVQENRLLNGGLDGDLNSNIVKLALGKHGYKERVEESGDPSAPKEMQIKVIYD